MTSLAEFTVYKVSDRHSEPVRRLLCLSEVCLIERDPTTYSICTLKPLGEVVAIFSFHTFFSSKKLYFYFPSHADIRHR
jgi:hypothetical protein